MSELTIEEKVFLIECYYSRGKIYSEAFRGFRAKYGSKKVGSETTLRRVINNFKEYGTLEDRRKDLPGPSTSVTTEETINEVKEYFEKNPHSSIRKAAQALKISKSSLHNILHYFLKMHPYKITTHQLLTERAMKTRTEFCNTLLQMLENGELSEKQIIFSDEAHFWMNGYVNKQNYRFWGSENPKVVVATSLHPLKVTVWAAVSMKGIYLHFFESTVTGESYKKMLETGYFPYAKKKHIVKNYYFMQDGAAPHRTQKVFEAINKIYDDRVIGLGYPRFIKETEME